MKPFEFYFDGSENSDKTVNAGIRKLSGEPVDIALFLGRYASESLKRKNDNTCAIIVLNAFLEFIRENPEMKNEAIERLTTAGVGRISPATLKDINSLLNKN